MCAGLGPLAAPTKAILPSFLHPHSMISAWVLGKYLLERREEGTKVRKTEEGRDRGEGKEREKEGRKQ